MAEFSSDSVTAEFEVVVDQSNIQTLDNLAKVLEDVQVRADSISRSFSDVVQHLRDIGTSSSSLTQLNSQASSVHTPQASTSDSQRESSREDVRESDKDMQQTRRGTKSQSTPTQPSRDAPSSVPEVQSALDKLKENDPQLYENLLAQRGRNNSFTQGLSTVTDLAQSVFSETRAGGSFEGVASLAARGLSGLSQSGLGGVSGLLGSGLLRGGMAASGVLAAGLTANQLVQAGGRQYQEYANLGSIRGGGAAEGAGFEMQVRTMAMNPFLTTEQSRQIVMSALSEGYTGQEFDNVTQYMSENLRKMNMSVAQSTQLLKTNVQEGGQSIQSLSNDLKSLKEITKSGVSSLEENQQAYQQQTSSMISQNIDAQQASNMALTSTALWNDDPVLSNAFGNITSGASDQLVRLAGRQVGVTGASAMQIRSQLGDQGKLGEGVYKYLHSEAQKLSKQYGNRPYMLQEIWYRRLQSLGIGVDPQVAAQLLNKFLEDEDGTGLEKARQEVEEINFGVQERSKGERFNASMKEGGNLLSTGLHAVGDTLSMLDFGWGKDESFKENFTKAYDSTGKARQAMSNAIAGERGYHVKALDDLYSQYGANNVDIVDSKGNTVRPTSEEDMNKILSGEYKVKVNGGTPTSLRDAQALNSQGALSGGSGGATSQTQVTISATDELRRLLKIDTKTVNQSRSDMGYSGSSRNNPPPEER